MWRVTIEAEDDEPLVVPLEEGVHEIGRARGNRIRLTERNVSRSHARLSLRGRHALIEDLESQHGTYVNAKPIARELRLGRDDVVQIGAYRIQVAVGPTDLDASAGPTLGQAARLVVISGGAPGTEFPLTKPRTTFGRGEGVDVQIDDASVSRTHCAVSSLSDGRFEAMDLGSANGIVCEGKLLKRAIMNPGDVLELGKVRMRLEVAPSTQPGAARAKSEGRRLTGKGPFLYAVFTVMTVASVAYAWLSSAHR